MRSLLKIILIFTINAVLTYSYACTRVLVSNADAVLVGRNMDWLSDMQANLWLYPEGKQWRGANSGNALEWQAKYGNIAAVVYDEVLPITTDGINEYGLAAHLLSLNESDYGKRDEAKPGLSILLWAQFYLDNFKTVAEAVQFTQKNTFQIVPFFHPALQKFINLHLALEDASGDSAVIEYINGMPKIYHGKEYKVLTNSPTFDQQLENIKQYQGFGGEKTLPGTTIPADRFVRASFYAAHLPETSSNSEAITQLLSVMDNVSQPFGTPSIERPKISQTIWKIVADLTHKVYYYHSSSSFNTVWVDLNKMSFKVGSPIMKLDLIKNPELHGEVSAKFKE